VRVSWQLIDGRVQVIVADEGIGVDADELPEVFKCVFQAIVAGHFRRT
jgi:signal transduction histidine kinase